MLRIYTVAIKAIKNYDNEGVTKHKPCAKTKQKI